MVSIDVLNSRSPYAKGFKKLLFLHNTQWWDAIIDESIKYLVALTVNNNMLLIKHRRKTFVLV